MSSMKIRHDFAAGEDVISGAQTHHGNLSNSRDESSSLHKQNQAALGSDVSGSDQVATIAKMQYERDSTSIDSASKMMSGNQKSQDIQQAASQQAIKYFGNN